MMSTAPLVAVIVGTPGDHSTCPAVVEMVPLNAPLEDWMIFRWMVMVVPAGWVNVKAHVDPAVSVTRCQLPLAGLMVRAVVQVPLSNSGAVVTPVPLPGLGPTITCPPYIASGSVPRHS